MFAGWGCVGLISVSLLVIFILFRAAFNVIDDPTGGMVVEVEQVESPAPAPSQTAPEDDERPVEQAAYRAADWSTDFEDATAQAREGQRPLVIVFTAEYSYGSRDVLEGVFSRPEVAALLESHFTRLHVDLDLAQEEREGNLPGIHPAVAACDLQFLPCVCYLDPETHALLIPNTTRFLSVEDALGALREASRAYVP